MRALTAILVLLCGGWSQVAALDCPMEAPPTAPAEDHGAAHEAMPDHGAGTEHGAPHHTDPSCGLLMACGPAVLGTSSSVTEGSPPTSATPMPGIRATRCTVFPTHDTPPPRLPV